jgi:hypothetical protein
MKKREIKSIEGREKTEQRIIYRILVDPSGKL